jgi:hypothetical protein
MKTALEYIEAAENAIQAGNDHRAQIYATLAVAVAQVVHSAQTWNAAKTEAPVEKKETHATKAHTRGDTKHGD